MLEEPEFSWVIHVAEVESRELLSLLLEFVSDVTWKSEDLGQNRVHLNWDFPASEDFPTGFKSSLVRRYQNKVYIFIFKLFSCKLTLFDPLRSEFAVKVFLGIWDRLTKAGQIEAVFPRSFHVDVVSLFKVEISSVEVGLSVANQDDIVTSLHCWTK